MLRTATLLILLALAATLAAQQQQQQQPPPDDLPRTGAEITVDPKPGRDAGSVLKVVDYHRDRVTPARGAAREVTLRQWSLAGSLRLTRFPEEGHLIVQLRGGQVITVIGGERRVRTDGEIWSVPPGVAMSVETGRDMAILEVLAVR